MGVAAVPAERPGRKGVFFAVTTGNDVFALDETTGATVWTKNLGSSPTANGVSCGNIHPLGILSTPVISASARTIYVGAAIGTNSISDHQIHALSVDDGSPKAGWPVSVSKVTSAGMTFMPPPQNQRSALSLVGGKVYAAYGGHVGDCGPYHGWVVAVDTTDPTKVGGWVTGGQGEGIWDAGGMASDGNGVFALTGNSTVGASTHLDSEEAVRITGMGTKSDTFFPTSWKSMDSGDADLGASNPVYFELPGATPSKILAVVSKDGNMYLLDAANLGGMGGQKAALQVSSGTMSIHTAVATYTTAKGRYVVFGTNSGAMCASASGEAIVSVLVPPGAPPKPTIAWCAPLSGPVTGPCHHDDRRDQRRRRLVHEQRQAGRRRWRRRELCLHEHRLMRRCPPVDLADRGERAHRRGRRRQALRLVSALRQQQSAATTGPASRRG